MGTVHDSIKSTLLPHGGLWKNTMHSPNLFAGTPLTLFEAWVDRFPESIAVVGRNGTLTYAELDRRANQIAHALRSAGVQKGDMVALFLERGPGMVCALLGVLKSGAAFVALDPRTPKEALARIFASVEDCLFVLSRRGLATGLPTTSAQLLLLDDPAWLASQPVSRPMQLAGPQDPACVLFTSGSSGHPKAVLYLHRNLATRFSTTMQVSGFNQLSVFAQSSTVT